MPAAGHRLTAGFCGGFPVWEQKKRGKRTIACPVLEQVRGIEPPYAAWEAAVLPMNYTCMSFSSVILTIADSFRKFNRFLSLLFSVQTSRYANIYSKKFLLGFRHFSVFSQLFPAVFPAFRQIISSFFKIPIKWPIFSGAWTFEKKRCIMDEIWFEKRL